MEILRALQINRSLDKDSLALVSIKALMQHSVIEDNRKNLNLNHGPLPLVVSLRAGVCLAT